MCPPHSDLGPLVAQLVIATPMLGLYLLHRVPNVYIRKRIGVTVIAKRVVLLKRNWAGHLGRKKDESWSRAPFKKGPRAIDTESLSPDGEWPSKWEVHLCIHDAPLSEN